MHNRTLQTLLTPAFDDRLEEMAQRCIQPLAFALAGLMFCSGLLVVGGGADGWSWRSILAVVSAAALAFIALRSRSGDVAAAESTLFKIMLITGINVLAPALVGSAGASGAWLAPLIVVAAAVHFSTAWFLTTQGMLAAGWFGVTLISGAAPGWSTATLLIAFTAPLAVVLFYQRRAQLARLVQEAARNELRAEKLQSRLDELRRGLRESAQTTAELNDKLERLSRIAETDELTGLPNRRYVREYLGSHWPIIQRAYRTISVLYLDLKRFHDFNHRFGYRAGDIVLGRIADMISRCARNELEVAARVGNDAFMLILPGCGRYKANEVAEDLNAKMSRLIVPEFGLREPGEVEANIGVASLRLDGEVRPIDLITSADRALAIARSGRSGEVVSFPREPRDRSPIEEVDAA